MEKPAKELLFAEERQSRILKQLKKDRKVLVPQLCEQFGVSPVTIRNDLNDMETRGLLKRTHGGAILTSKTGFEQNTVQKLVKNQEQKDAIGKLAAALVEDGDILALDTGTTIWAFVRHLVEKRRLTVVTNDLQIASFLEEETDSTIVLAGGTVRRNYHCTIGPITLSCLEHLQVDKCFLATNGFTLERGLSTPDLQQAEVKRKLASLGEQRILLCDSEKMGSSSFVTVLPAQSIQTLVTDTGLDSAIQEQLEQAGIEVRLA